MQVWVVGTLSLKFKSEYQISTYTQSNIIHCDIVSSHSL